MMRAGLAVVLVSVFSAATCSKQLWGLPRIAMSAASPDGHWVAYARNHPTLDGPDQSVWLRSAYGSAVQLRKLGADSEWITAIVWSVDSRRIAFLTMDAVLDVYDVASRSRLASGYVLPNRGDYPPRYAVRDVSFSIDGGAVTFLPCERNYDVTNDRPERLTCRDSRESLTIAELADRQARLYQGRVF